MILDGCSRPTPQASAKEFPEGLLASNRSSKPINDIKVPSVTTLVILGLLSSSPADIYTSKTTEPEAPDAAPSKGTVVSQSEGQRDRKDIILRPHRNVWSLGKINQVNPQ